MREFTFHTELWLPRRRDEIFPFFAEARNLETITPPWLNFEILTPAPVAMRAGARIDYRIRVHGIPIRWRTEIVEWNAPYRFVDVQLRGPYTLWHHTHTFEERDGGTLCLDDVRYRPHGGTLTNWLFVRRDVKNIFAFRSKLLAQMFPTSVAEIRGANGRHQGPAQSTESVADHLDVAHDPGPPLSPRTLTDDGNAYNSSRITSGFT